MKAAGFLYLKRHFILALYLALFLGGMLARPTLLMAYGPCDQDGEKLCAGLSHKETLKNCLHRRKLETSQACQAFLKTQEETWQKTIQSWAQVLQSCKDEMSLACKETVSLDEQDGAFKNMKDQQVCLMVHREKLTQTCKDQINKHIRQFQPGLHTLE